MTTTTEFQPYFNKAMNQPRTCIWIEPENIQEYKLLQKLNESIVSTDKIKSGFTGMNKNTLLIQFPQ